MPTLFSHPAVPVAIRIGVGHNIISNPLLIAGCIAAVLPDLDVLAFRFGIPYASAFGHRGFSHSIFFALLIAVTGGCCYKLFKSSFLKVFLFLFIAIASHGILDALTKGGLGVAFFWPFSAERYFFPFKLIEVSPITMTKFFSPRGAAVVLSELVWIWLPLIVIASVLALLRIRTKPTTSRLEKKTI